MVPNLALDPRTGTLHLAYYDSEGGPGRFVHASCGPGVTKCRVHGAINSVPFVELTTSRDPKKSVGDRATLLVDDRRRLLYAVCAADVPAVWTMLFSQRVKLRNRMPRNR